MDIFPSQGLSISFRLVVVTTRRLKAKLGKSFSLGRRIGVCGNEWETNFSFGTVQFFKVSVHFNFVSCLKETKYKRIVTEK
jgi:hypothetical protein